MQLEFEHSQKIVNGANPAIYHSPDNIIQVLFLDDNRQIRTTQAETPLGNFADLEFFGSGFAALDTAVANLKIAYLPRVNVWAVWLQVEAAHRMATFLLKQEMNKYFVDGSLSFADDPCATLNLTLENPAGIIAAEDVAEMSPGIRIGVYFKIGDSVRVPLGSYYIDRIVTKTGDPRVQITARNIIGKLLKDQTVDGNAYYPVDTITNVLTQLLDNAHVPLYRIEATTVKIGIECPYNMTYFDATQSILSVTKYWTIKEDINGAVCIGGANFMLKHVPSGIYTFERNRDCFSREVVRDDREVYSRMCVHDKGFNLKIWRDLSFDKDWNMPMNKTLYIELPEGTGESYANEILDYFADRLPKVGVLETFSSPFRPHIQPGDRADIVEPGKLSRTIGVITQVDHSFGRSGFYTDFTVDRGGVFKKPQLSDVIGKIGGKKTVGDVKITRD